MFFKKEKEQHKKEKVSRKGISKLYYITEKIDTEEINNKLENEKQKSNILKNEIGNGMENDMNESELSFSEKRKRRRDKKEESKKKKHKIIKRILLGILCAIIIAGAVFAYKVYKNGWGIKGVVSTAIGVDTNQVKNMPPIYALLVGTNEDNTDTILVLGYNPKTQEMSLLSIPRDTFVGENVKKGKAKDKINAIYRMQGIDKLLAKVNKLLGMDIKHYVVIDTKGLAQLVDSIGGVWYDVPIDMNYHDAGQKLSIELKAGYQKLNGKQAEGLVRFRHSDNGKTYPQEYGIEDHGRNKTQRTFIKETMKQTIKVQNITKIFDILNIVEKNVKTNISMDLAKQYVPSIMEFEPENIKQGIVEGEDVNTTAWFFLADTKKLEKMVFDLFVFSDDPKKEEAKKKEEEMKKLEEENKQSKLEKSESIDKKETKQTKTPVQNKKKSSSKSN